MVSVVRLMYLPLEPPRENILEQFLYAGWEETYRQRARRPSTRVKGVIQTVEHRKQHDHHVKDVSWY